MPIKYPKIEALYKLGSDFKATQEYRNAYFKYLEDNEWLGFEKIDGTNLRLYWDGYNLSFHGRTDKTDWHPDTLAYLNSRFNKDFENKVEEIFKDKQVIIFGELVGPKIQNKHKDWDVYVFDIVVFDKNNQPQWLDFLTAVEDITKQLNLKTVPLLVKGGLGRLISYVKDNRKSTVCEDFELEGLVARPAVRLSDNQGNRIITKIKYEDIKNMSTLDVEAQLEKETKMLIDFIEKEFDCKIIDTWVPVEPARIPSKNDRGATLLVKFEDHDNFEIAYGERNATDNDTYGPEFKLDKDLYLKCDSFIKENDFLVIEFVSTL